MRLSARSEPYEGECSVTTLLPPPSGWRGLVGRGSRELYDFGNGDQEWRRGSSTLGYLLSEAVVIDYPKRGQRNREFVGLLVVKTGHVAVAGVLSGWRLATSEASQKTADDIDDPASSMLAVTELPEVRGATRLSEAPRLVIPESRLIPVAEWKQRAADWPGLRSAHNLPPDGRPQATIRDPARVAQIFTQIQANPEGLP